METMKHVMREFRKASRNITVDELKILEQHNMLTPVLKKILEEYEGLLSHTSFTERGS